MIHKKFLGAACAALVIVIAIFLLAPGAWAQSKFKTLYKFTGGADGYYPYGGLIFDQAGNLYGTTMWGGILPGTVFKLTPQAGGSWTKSVLYSFTGGPDGGFPNAGLIFDQAGNLYGSAFQGGGGYRPGGVIFMLAPNPDGSWSESVLYSFCSITYCPDGDGPSSGLIFDQAGNLYGTASHGGLFEGYHLCSAGCGVVFELTPNSDRGWTESVLYSFTGGADGGRPYAGLIFDVAGNLYGTTIKRGPYRFGMVFKLAPNQDGSWTETVLHRFKDGSNRPAGLVSGLDFRPGRKSLRHYVGRRRWPRPRLQAGPEPRRKLDGDGAPPFHGGQGWRRARGRPDL